MAKKNIKIYIDDIETDVAIRRIKKKEFKALTVKIAEKGDAFANFINKADSLKALPIAIGENIDFICTDMIMPFASLSFEQLEEMDVTDIVYLFNELLLYNGINKEKLKNFFRPDATAVQTIKNAMNFGGIGVPS